ncbi:ATP-binding protein [Peptoniphilus equinus]|uniref:ATP-binding protein n=1 Tax=Peptoniphilus equinus TaxID=3016343 RepID=A0ABY7QUR9_9FIRM|nr:ATP-binding protein [Peptoniphilus equinus]WBW50522.1 ATP-binding protein [Peptoniphilus equinus]
MYDMTVVGMTSSREVYAANRKRNFRINEFLVIEDASGDILAEVVEANTFNRYIPLEKGGDFVDQSVIESLKSMGYDVSDETIYLAKLRLLREANYPIISGSSLRLPHFSEVKSHLIGTEPEAGLILGAIRNTDDIAKDMPESYKDHFETLEGSRTVMQYEVPYIMDYRSMHEYPHIGVFGGSGSGKSFGLRVILEELMKKSVPTVVLDPHYEMDFQASAYEDKFSVHRIGHTIGIRFEDLYASDLKNLLETSGNLSDPMKNSIDMLFNPGESFFKFNKRVDAIVTGFDYGSVEKIDRKIDDLEAEGKRDEAEKLKHVRATFDKYQNATNPATLKGILWRLDRLKYEGVLNKDIAPIIDGLMAGKLQVVQGSTRTIEVFATYLISKLYKMRREYREGIYAGEARTFFPPFVIVTDEAHNFAPKGLESPAKYKLREIAQEGRKYGVFLVLATQRPTLLDETITAQLNTKLIFRTVRASDIDTIREETDISLEESKRLPYLTTGDVFISSSKMGRTAYVRIRMADTKSPHKENPFDELDTIRHATHQTFYEDIKAYLPISPGAGGGLAVLQELEKDGIRLTLDQLVLKLDGLVDAGLVELEENPIFGKVYTRK